MPTRSFTVERHYRSEDGYVLEYERSDIPGLHAAHMTPDVPVDRVYHYGIDPNDPDLHELVIELLIHEAHTEAGTGERNHTADLAAARAETEVVIQPPALRSFQRSVGKVTDYHLRAFHNRVHGPRAAAKPRPAARGFRSLTASSR